jgi:hypothetical protein
MAITPNSPIYTPFTPFLSGLQLAYGSTTTLTVAAGVASDSTVTNEINLPAFVTINAAANGANGLDTGTVANASFYAIYVVGDSTGYNATCGLMSLSATAPVLPAHYDMFRRVGYVLTDGSAHILDFSQRGDGLSRDMWYAAAIATNITAGASATFAAVTASASVPAPAAIVHLKAVLTADAGATRTAAFKATSSSSAAGQAFMWAPASTVATLSVDCPCDASGAISYLVSNAAAAIAISVSGYVDPL